MHDRLQVHFSYTFQTLVLFFKVIVAGRNERGKKINEKC